jgi:hypothetical protein
MATKVRPEVSTSNKYWINKHRYYELKHFCLQYVYWKNIYMALNNTDIPLSMIEHAPTDNTPSDPTAKRAILKAYYSNKIDLLERVAIETDEYLYKYILKAVTEGLSYSNLKSKYEIPCGKDMYYDRYRRFFWLLDRSRD